MFRTKFEAIGTIWDIRIFDPFDSDTWVRLSKNIQERIEAFDHAYSRFRSDSLVTQMAQHAGTYLLPEDGYKLLNFYDRLYQATDGAVTPLIGQAIVAAGYDATYSFKPHSMHELPKWEEVLAYDKDSITLKRPALLDFGAAGKGYLVDIIAGQLAEVGIGSFFINAGGDILHRSVEGKGVMVGLENPVDTSEAIGTLELTNRSLCSSAGSKRAWGEYTHIIDPVSLHSPKHVLATWVLANDTITADGLATALFFTEPKELQKTFTFSYAVLHDDMSLNYVLDFPVKLFEASR